MEDVRSEWRLPRLAVEVRLLRAGRAPEAAEMFVSQAHGGTAIAEEVATRLEDDTQFLPVREGDRVALVGKRAIVWVAVPIVRTADEDVLSLFDHQHDVRVELDVADGIDGRVLYSSPADRPRLADHLNLPVHFIRVWTNDVLYLVNKQHIVRVVELT